MNIKFTMIENGQVTEKTIPLCGQGRPEGSADGLLPIKLASNVTVAPKLTIYTSTTVNRNKGVSAVIKASLPYTALAMAPDSGTITGVDPARSGSEFSIHTVVTIPAAMRADLRGANGGTQQLNALRQLMVLVGTFSAVLGDRFADAGPAFSKMGEGMAASYGRYYSASETRLTPTIKPQDLLGSVGFDVSGTTPAQIGLNEPLNRIVAGMPPIGCEDVERLPLVQE